MERKELGLNDPKLNDSFRDSILRLFENLPSHNSKNRAQNRRLERLTIKFEGVISERGKELMDALTDSVKDFPTVQEIERANKLLSEVFNKGVGKELIEKLNAAIASVPVSEKATVIKSRLGVLRSNCNDLLEKIVETDWDSSGNELSEEFYEVAQVMSHSITLIDSMKYALTINPNTDVSQGISSLLYLTLRTLAFLLGKVSKDSLRYTVSAVQVYLFSTAPFLISA